MTWSSGAIVIALCGCGRLGFDDRATGDSNAGDSNRTGDSNGTSDTSAATGITYIGSGFVVDWVDAMAQVEAVSNPDSIITGDLLILHVTYNGTLVAPNGWTLATPEWAESHCSLNATQIFYRFVAVNEGVGYAVTCSGSCTAAITAFRDVDPTTPFEQIGPLGTTTETQVCGTNLTPQLQVVPSLTTLVSGDLVVLFYGDNNDVNIGGTSVQTLPAGYTQMYNYLGNSAAQNLLAGYTGPVPAGLTGPQTVTATFENVYGWTAVQVGLKRAP